MNAETPQRSLRGLPVEFYVRRLSLLAAALLPATVTGILLLLAGLVLSATLLLLAGLLVRIVLLVLAGMLTRIVLLVLRILVLVLIGHLMLTPWSFAP